MGNGGSGSGDVFDVRKVRRLVELMNEHELAEVDLRQGDQRIRLLKGHEPIVASAAPVPSVPSSAPVAASATPTAPSPEPEAEDANAKYVTSPMVGTFYVASGPETPAFVSVGDQVSPDTTVCVIEAMKVFNEIPAECSGTIAAVLVNNGDSVEYGQKLFQLK